MEIRGVAASEGGWLLFHLDNGVSGAVRCDEAEDGRLHLAELVTHPKGRALRGSDLRDFPLGPLEAAANGELREDLLQHLARRAEVVWRRHNGRYRDELPALVKPDPGVSSLVVAVPSTRPYPDDFYADVGIVYMRAARASSRPAAQIAEHNGVSVTQVHRWVAESRRRGHLPPARPGRAG